MDLGVMALKDWLFTADSSRTATLQLGAILVSYPMQPIFCAVLSLCVGHSRYKPHRQRHSAKVECS